MRLDRGAISKNNWNRLIPSVKGYTVVDSAVKKVFDGTCEACVYGRGAHVDTCPISKRNNVARKVLKGELTDEQEIKAALE